MPEVWKPVLGFESNYEVSSHGRVRSIDHTDHLGRCWVGRIRKQQAHPRTGHLSVTLSSDYGRRVAKVHQLVLEAFVGPRPNGMVCCHYDGNPQNNHLDNLRWGTATDNWDDMKRHGTTPIQTRQSVMLAEPTPQMIHRAARNVHKLTPTKRSSSGVRGVSRCGSTNKWVVRVKAANKYHWGGRFDSLSEAVSAAKTLKQKLSADLSEQMLGHNAAHASGL